MSRTAESSVGDSITSQAAILSELVASYLDRSIRDSGLTLGLFELLSAVKGSPSATQADLAEKLGITPSSLCEAVRSAAKKGFVEQEESATDRRSKRVVLTRKGAQLLSKALQALQAAESQATAGMSPTKLAGAIETLRQASRNLAV